MSNLRSLWCVLAALASLSLAATTDQVPLTPATKLFRTFSRSPGQKPPLVAASQPLQQSSKISVRHSHDVEVKYVTFDDTWFFEEDGPNRTYTSDWDGYLQFNHFNALLASWAEEEGYVDFRDLDCAASKPSALYSSPNNFTSRTVSVIRSNATALAEAGLSEFFDVIAWSWKPMGPTSSEHLPWLNLDLWRVIEDPEKPNKAEYRGGIGTVWFEDDEGFFGPDTTVCDWFSPDLGKAVNWVEFDAKNYEEGGESFSFCLDNLVLLFHGKERDDEE